ncbi:hypothetical protein PABG_11308 [Paracoccidioides brasiliensis Pb03]|nr:hypothetical protein PABG_11308 [Paracoccidioides brasiliensis Pb03]
MPEGKSTASATKLSTGSHRRAGWSDVRVDQSLKWRDRLYQEAEESNVSKITRGWRGVNYSK